MPGDGRFSLRRSEGYEEHRLTFRSVDDRQGPGWETLRAVELIGRMIQHLPAKGFRMVRDDGIYARTVRQKVHAPVAEVLAQLQEKLRRVRERFRGKGGTARATAEAASDEPVALRAVQCPGCGRAMELVRIWDARRGVIYERARKPQVAGSTKAGDLREEGSAVAQRLFGFVENLVRKPGVVGAWQFLRDC